MALKDYVSAVDVIQLDGSSQVVGTPTTTVLEVDSSQNVLLSRGTSVPTDADAGYAVGALFIKTDGTIGTTLYINEGSATSADFNAIESVASVITGITAGTDLTGGGTSGTPTVSLSPTITQALTLTPTQGMTFGTAFGNSGSAAIFRFNGFNNGVGTATGTAFTGNVYNIAVQIPNVGTAYIKATTTV